MSVGLETVDQSPDRRVSSEGLGSVILEQGSESTADVVAVAPVDCMTTVVIVVALLMIKVILAVCPLGKSNRISPPRILDEWRPMTSEEGNRVQVQVFGFDWAIKRR